MEAPSAEALAWAEAALGISVSGAARMAGGIDAHTFRLLMADGSAVVLRLTEPDHHEDVGYLARVLDLLEPTPVPAPLHLAHVTALDANGPPVMLQSLLEGDPTIPPEPDDEYLRSLVTTIVRTQELPVRPWMHDRAAVRWNELATVDAEDLSPGDRLLMKVLRDRGPAAPCTHVFGHDDFWVGNTLRDGHSVVGVVDWGHAGAMSVARDATYCAVDTSLCYGLHAGDRLVELFTDQVAVDPEELLVWSARSVLSSRFFAEWLVGWNGLGVPVRHEQAARRRTELLDRVLARLG